MKQVQMLVVVALMLLVVAPMVVQAGTFRDDFEDGDWKGWKGYREGEPGVNVAENASVVDGVLRLNHLALYILEGWTDYTLAANMRIVETEPGAS